MTSGRTLSRAASRSALVGRSCLPPRWEGEGTRVGQVGSSLRTNCEDAVRGAVLRLQYMDL